MRRKDRELTADEAIAVVAENKVLRLAMTDGDKPYVVPLNYGYTYENGVLTFYLHCARQGRKLCILEKNSNICFEIDSRHELVSAEKDCDWGYRYASVIGSGRFAVICGERQKYDALAQIMRHQTGCPREYRFDAIGAVEACRLDITEFSGKACL